MQRYLLLLAFHSYVDKCFLGIEGKANVPGTSQVGNIYMADRFSPVTRCALHLVVIVLHLLEGPVELLWSDVADANALTNVGDERDALLTMTMLNGILAALPGQLGLKIRGVGRER